MEKKKPKKITRITEPADLLSSKNPEIQDLVKDSFFVAVVPGTGATLVPANVLPRDYKEEEQDLVEKFSSGAIDAKAFNELREDMENSELEDADSIISMEVRIGDQDA